MKNRNLMMGLGFMAFSMSMQAQTTLVSLGFEDADSKYHTTGSLSGLGTYGDWVNPKDGDQWNEKCPTEPKSGEYCLFANNGTGVNGQSWDRGFKIGNLTLKENTPYRVSFWLKVESSTFADPESGDTKNTGLRAWLSKGIENYDKSLCTASGTNYGIEKDGDFSGEWQHFSFVSFYTSADIMNKYVSENQSWVGDAVCPENLGGDGTKKYKEVFENRIPEQFFAIVNMHSPVNYFLDDIKIEEGVTFNEARHDGSIIRLDFGYTTNVAELAQANGGTISLNKDNVKVTSDGADVPVHLFEGKADGFVYIFLEEGAELGKDVKVSFTPDADCPLKYSGEKRPNTDTETEMAVLGFENETVYEAENEFEVYSSEDVAPVMLSATPENNSFNLSKDDFKEITVTFDKEINLFDTEVLCITKDNFGEHSDEIKDIKVGSDPKTLVITLPELSNGEYVFEINGIANNLFVTADDPIRLTYEIGKSTIVEMVDTIYASHFADDPTDCVPEGWFTKNEAGIHQYGFNDEARTSQYNYGWGGTPGGGGARLYQGFSGDFTKALYWGSRGTNEGICTFGQLVEDYLTPDGLNLVEDTPDDIKRTALKLTPRKYQITFQMAAWKNAPVFTFTLEDLQGNVYAKFTDFVATPNMNGATGKVTGSLKCQSDFTVEKEGFYVLKFAAQDAQWQEFLLANVTLTTMPSKSSYYMGLMAQAIDDAQKVYNDANDPKFDGETKNALKAEIEKTTAGMSTLTAPSAVEAQIEALKAAADALTTRSENFESFEKSKNDIDLALLDLEVVGEKYLNSKFAVEARKLFDQYKDVDPSTLNDADLAAATEKLVAAAKYVANIASAVDALTWGATKAAMIAEKLGVTGEKLDAVKALTDDDAKVIGALNGEIAYALVSKLSKGESIEELKESVFNTSIVAVEPEESQVYNENDNPEEFKGIDLSSFVRNSHLYRVNGVDGVPGWVLNPGAEGSSVALSFNENPSDEKPVIDCQVSSYGNNNYDLYQEIEGLPAGYYTLCIQTRTPLVTKDVDDVPTTYYYNAQNDEGVWDKYIYAKGDDDSEGVAPYAGASGLVTTFVKDIKVTNGKLTIGAKENYVSGKAVSHESNEATDFWTGTSYLDYVNIYFVRAIDGFDYAGAATGVENVNASAVVTDIYSVGGVRQNKLVKGINIVKMSDGNVRRVIVK